MRPPFFTNERTVSASRTSIEQHKTSPNLKTRRMSWRILGFIYTEVELTTIYIAMVAFVALQQYTCGEMKSYISTRKPFIPPFLNGWTATRWNFCLILWCNSNWLWTVLSSSGLWNILSYSYSAVSVFKNTVIGFIYFHAFALVAKPLLAYINLIVWLYCSLLLTVRRFT